MEINIQATPGQCTEFMGANGERREISVVIAPLKVNVSEAQDHMNIISGCNMWKSCLNVGCYYSLESRKKGASGKGQLAP